MKDDSRVELDIDTGDKEKNKKLFDQLLSKREKIEKAFGGRLEWHRQDETRVSRIIAHVKKRGWKDESRWNELQDEMIDTMIRFNKVFKSHILSAH